jgi:hypothetical protein
MVLDLRLREQGTCFLSDYFSVETGWLINSCALSGSPVVRSEICDMKAGLSWQFLCSIPGGLPVICLNNWQDSGMVKL